MKSGIPSQITGDYLSDVTPGTALTFASTPVHPPTAWTTATTTLGSKSYVKRADSSTTAPSTSPPTSPPESNATEVPLTQSSGGRELSTGAYVGIGLGAAVGVIGVITLLLVLHVLHRNRNSPNTFQQSTLATTELPHNRTSFMSGNRTRGQSFELPGKPLSIYFPGYSARNAGRPSAGLV